MRRSSYHNNYSTEVQLSIPNMRTPIHYIFHRCNQKIVPFRKYFYFVSKAFIFPDLAKNAFFCLFSKSPILWISKILMFDFWAKSYARYFQLKKKAESMRSEAWMASWKSSHVELTWRRLLPIWSTFKNSTQSILADSVYFRKSLSNFSTGLFLWVSRIDILKFTI